MVLRRIGGIVRHQGHFRRQLEAFQRFGHLCGVEFLGIGGGKSAGPGRGIAEPGTGGRHLAGLLLDAGDEIVEMRHIILAPIPFEGPVADPRFRRQALQGFQLLLRAGQVEFLVEAELDRLLDGIDHVIAGQVEDHHIRIGGLRLDQIGAVIGGAERRQVGAGFLAAQLLGLCLEATLQGVAEGVIGGDVIPFLADILGQRAGNGADFHICRVADPEDIPMAVRAGDRIGMAARHHQQALQLGGNLAHGEGHSGIHIAQQEIDLVALDQLAGFLHGCPDIATGGILHQELGLTTEDAALGIDLVNRVFGAELLVLAECRIGAGQRIAQAELHRIIGAGLENKW